MAQIECPRCRGKIDPRSTRCRHCQADFTPEELASLRETDERQKHNQRTGCLVLVGVVLLVVAIGQCSSTTDTNSASDTGASDVTSIDPLVSGGGNEANGAGPPATPASNWNYSSRRDEVRNDDIVEASIRSSNTTTLDFPYGTVHLNIVVRKHPEWGQDVIFIVDEGQILCNFRDCGGTINIDGSTERLSLNESADNDSAVVFAQYPAAIINKLKTSERVVVELPFFQNGNRQFTFETRGLEWPPEKGE